MQKEVMKFLESEKKRQEDNEKQESKLKRIESQRVMQMKDLVINDI